MVLLLLLVACAPIRELTPQTAASRITSRDSYKEEACQIMQEYADFLYSLNWEAPTRLEYKPVEELSRLHATFELLPEVQCSLKAGKRMYQIDARKFSQIVDVIQWLQSPYQGAVLEGSLENCVDCEFPNYPRTNALLVEYFKQPPFAALRKKHAADFQRVCLDADNLDRNRSELALHDGHTLTFGTLNGSFESHGDCEAIWRAVVGKSVCNHYRDWPYLLCTNGVWEIAGDNFKPISFFKPDNAKIVSFPAGFARLRIDSADVYWKETPTKMKHAVIGYEQEEVEPTLRDVHGNGATDLVVGGQVFFSQGDETAIRQTLAHFRALREKMDKLAIASRAERESYQRIESLSLDELEKLLMTTHKRDEDLLERAATESWQRWQETRDDRESLHHQTEAYYHMVLWNRAANTRAIPEEHIDALRMVSRLHESGSKLQSIAKAYRRGDQERINEVCADLEKQIVAARQQIEEAIEGSKAASRSIGQAWRFYLNEPFPAVVLQKILSAWERTAEAKRNEASAMCKDTQ